MKHLQQTFIRAAASVRLGSFLPFAAPASPKKTSPPILHCPGDHGASCAGLSGFACGWLCISAMRFIFGNTAGLVMGKGNQMRQLVIKNPPGFILCTQKRALAF
jgi:hypothetical protein